MGNLPGNRHNGQLLIRPDHPLPLTPLELTRRIKAEALRIGFQAAGVAPASALTQRQEALARWIQAGRAGGLPYMEAFLERQARFLSDLPDLRSILVLAAPYASSSPPSPQRAEGCEGQGERKTHGRVARYAWGRDYHPAIRKRLRHLEAFIRTTLRTHNPELETAAWYRYSIDTAPLQERVLAEAAGLGFFGKNTCLIRPRMGSYFFLATFLTNIEMVPDRPIRWDCGGCTLCIQACPTGALDQPYELNANRCLSTLTIELRHEESVDPALRPRMGDWIFGCDLCQEVCPYNQMPEDRRQRSEDDLWPEFRPEAGAGGVLALEEVLSIRTEEAFLKRFAATPLTRPKRAGLLRNAAIAAGNSNEPRLIPLLEELAREDPSATVREHAAWALEAIRSSAARRRPPP